MKIIPFLGLIFLLASCNGGGGGSAGGSSISSTMRSISGIVVDGYIQGAAVCLDLNMNGLCDAGEPITLTNQSGEFSFSTEALESKNLVPVIAKGGTDTATGKAYQGELKKVVNLNDVGVTTHAITPLTDLSATHFLESETKDVLSLNLSNYVVSRVLMIDVNDLGKNPLGDPVVFSKAQEIENIKSLIETVSVKAAEASTEIEKEKIRKKIKESIVDQMETDFMFGRDSVDLEGVINQSKTRLQEFFPSFDISENEKNFLLGQISEIKSTLQGIQLIGDPSKLTEIQAKLSTEVENAHTAILGSGGGIIPVVGISDSLIDETEDNTPDDPSGDGGEVIPPPPTTNPPVISPPVAYAGTSYSTISKLIRLNGSGSTDPANATLTYSWEVTSKPAGSTVTFSSTTTVSPTASVDKYGPYVFTLTVNNGSLTSSSSVTVTVDKVVEYTNSLPENSVGMISDHLTKEAYSSFVNGHFYDTSDYMSLATTRVNTNGVRVEKINLSSASTESLTNYDTTNPIYRLCISTSTCLRGFTHKTDKDKLFIEKLDHVNKTASEYILTSKAVATETYIQKSHWNIVFKNNAIYIFRKLFVSLDTNNYGPFDTEILKFNLNFERIWSTVIKTSSYGTGANNVVSKDAYSPYYTTWLILESYAGKLLLHNYASGNRSGAENIIINDSNGAVESVVNYFAYENNTQISSKSHYPTFTKNGKLYFSEYYNFHSGSGFSTTNGALFYYLDTNFNPSRATVVTSTDSSLYFSKSLMSSENDVIELLMINKSTGGRIVSKKGYLYFSDLSVDRVIVHHDLIDEWSMDSAQALAGGNNNVKINGQFYTNHIAYADVFSTKASSLSSVEDLNRHFLSVRYGTSSFSSASIELDDFGLHPGCFDASTSTNNRTEISYSVKDLEVRKFTYEVPEALNRNVTVTSFQRGVVSEEIEERAPWLCSSYAMDLDLKIRLFPGGTVNSHTHDRGHYRYTLISAPTKGTVTIYQPGNFSISGNTIVQYKANSGVQGTDSYRLIASDGTGTKIVTVTVEFK